MKENNKTENNKTENTKIENTKIENTKIENNNLENIFSNNKILFIILGIVLIIVLIGVYYIYTICYDGDGYHRIGVPCWARIKEHFTNTDRSV